MDRRFANIIQHPGHLYASLPTLGIVDAVPERSGRTAAYASIESSFPRRLRVLISIRLMARTVQPGPSDSGLGQHY
jgi:hypothetical protein